MQARRSASKLFVLVFLLLTFSNMPVALARPPVKPLGLTKGVQPLSNVDIRVMQAVDRTALLAEDLLRERQGLPPRYAVSLAVGLTPWNSGTWENLEGGERLWRLRIRSLGASSLNFGFGRYGMPAGGKLFVYSTDGAFVRGPFTDEDNEAHGELWTPVVLGDEAVIEVSVPDGLERFLELHLTSVNHGYKTFWGGLSEKAGDCNVDVVCREADEWRDEIRSVGLISIGGRVFCSGFLVNNTAGDLKPYFMTAAHCGITARNAASVVVYWNFETTVCGGTPNGTLNQYNTGAIFRAAGAASDFCLVELDDPPEEAFNVHWAGWDNSDSDPVRATAIHHPSRGEKSISFEYDPLMTTSYLDTSVPGDGTHLRVEDWDVGTTENGSSGSGLWNQDHRIVGQLHGGYAACGNDLPDWYGRFSVSWDAGGTPAARLKDWLDPEDTGAITLDGMDACDRPDVEFRSDSNPAQTGTPVRFRSTVSGGMPPYSYSWDVDGDGVTDYTTEHPTHIYREAFSGNVRLTVSDSRPCFASVTHHQAVCPAGQDCTCVDNDGDGYGKPSNFGCVYPELDCDDSNPRVNPGRSENCSNIIDDDCDGKVDYADSECDGYASVANAEASLHGPVCPERSGLFNEVFLLFGPIAAVLILKTLVKRVHTSQGCRRRAVVSFSDIERA